MRLVVGREPATASMGGLPHHLATILSFSIFSIKNISTTVQINLLFLTINYPWATWSRCTAVMVLTLIGTPKKKKGCLVEWVLEYFSSILIELWPSQHHCDPCDRRRSSQNLEIPRRLLEISSAPLERRQGRSCVSLPIQSPARTAGTSHCTLCKRSARRAWGKSGHWGTTYPFRGSQVSVRNHVQRSSNIFHLSTGGLVLKHALVLALTVPEDPQRRNQQIRRNCSSIAFFGTPRKLSISITPHGC